MRRKLNNYIVFVYTHYIQEDWDEYNKLGKIFIKPAWFIRSILAIIYSVVCFPLVLFHITIDKIDIAKYL